MIQLILIAFLLNMIPQDGVFVFDDPVKQEVWDQLQQVNKTWLDDRNPDGLAQFCHPDYVLMFSGSEPIYGIDNVIASYKEFLANAEDIETIIKDPQIRLYCDSQTALVSLKYSMKWKSDSGPVEVIGKNMLVFVKQHGKWILTAEHFSDTPTE